MVFSFTESGVVPGRVKFVSFATDPKRKKLELQWTFGDGGKDTWVHPIHEYAKPGEYKVTLKATNPAGAFGTATNNITVKAPALNVSLRFVDRKDARPTLGETNRVRATVSASRNGLGALSNLRFDSGTVLGINEVFEVISEPESTAIGTLEPGKDVVFDWTLKVVNAGKFTLRTASVSGVDAAGRAVMHEGGGLPGNVSGLNVEVVFPGGPIQMKKKPQQPGELSSNPGYEPASFPVKVKVSVPAKGKPVQNVTLQGWDMSDSGLDIDQVRATGLPEQPWTLVIPQPVPFPLTVTNKPPEATIAKVLTEKDPPLEFDFIVRAERPGSFEFGALFTAKLVGADTVLQERGSNIRSLLGDLVLSVQVEIVNKPAEIKEGEAVEVFGIVKNLTDNETILLDPIRIISTGQGIVLGPVDQKADLPSVGSLGIFSPILTPEGDGKEARFRARVKTVRLAGLDQRILVSRQSVALDFSIGGEVVGEDGQKRELAPENMVVEWGNGHYDEAGVTYLRVPVEPNPLAPRELAWDDFALQLYGSAEEFIVQGGGEGIVAAGQFLASTPDLAWQLSSYAKNAAEENAMQYMREVRYCWAIQRWMLAVATGISPETRKEEVDAISAEIKAYWGRKFDSVEKVKPLVDKALTSFFASTITTSKEAYDHDYEFNRETVAQLTSWTRPVTAFFVENAIEDLALGMAWARFSKSPKVADDLIKAAEKQAAKDAVEVEAAAAAAARRGDAGHPSLIEAPSDLRNLRGGAELNQSQAIRAYAVDKVTDNNLIEYTKHMPVLVAIRSRADEMLEWMRTKLGMTPKGVNLKQKNVSLIDEEFLEYRKGVGYGDPENLYRGAGDRGSLICAEPIPPHVVEAKLAGASDELRKEVVERYRERWDEW